LKYKILVIGSPGSGKTYFSDTLGRKYNIVVFHLDDLYLDANWERVSSKEEQELYSKMIENAEYIMDGSYVDTLPQRIADANTIVWLHRSMLVCILQYTKRYLHSLFGNTSVLPKHIRESNQKTLSEEGYFSFVRYIMQFHQQKNDEITKLLSMYSTKKIYIIKRKKDSKNFLLY
jgi:adenylate kinase family enzyme